MESLRFEINPTPDETRRACTAIAQACLPPSRGNAILFGMYVVVGLAAYFLTPATRPITFLIGLIAVVATALLLQADGRLRVRRLQLDDTHARETHFVELTPEGVRAWCSHVDARYQWKDFFKVIENDEFYLLLRPSGNGSAIPKRLLDDSTDAELRDHIRAWAPDRGAGLARELIATSHPPSNER
jgi:hypothetical protein